MTPLLPPDAELEQDRRGFPRYFPRALVPLMFAHRDAETPTAGHIGDVSRSGVRIVAPPMARPFLHWPDALTIDVMYSEEARAAGIEGLKLRAHVVRIQGRCAGGDGDWDALMAWISMLGQ